MRIEKQFRLLFLLSTILVALYYSATSYAQRESIDETQRETLTIPVGVHILDSVGNRDNLSSQRTVESLRNHYARVNRIWRQADIVIEPVAYHRMEVPQDLLWGIVHRTGRGGIRDFFRGARRGEVEFPDSGNDARIWAFYVSDMGGPNGMAPSGSRTFFVADTTTVDDARVTSHEIGHLLGLYHARYDQSMLLFSGANGVVLTEAEQDVARYNAKRFLRR